MMKKKFQTPVITIYALSVQDVITSSLDINDDRFWTGFY